MQKRYLEYTTKKARLNYAECDNGLPTAGTVRYGGKLLGMLIVHRLGYNSDMYRGL